MIIDDIKSIKNGKKELQKFGLALGIVSLLWIGLFSWHRKTWYPHLFVLPGILIIFAYVYPSALKLPHKSLRVLFILINWIITRFVLCILFYFVLTPISIIFRLFGKKFLDLKFNKSANSYWVLKESSYLDRKSYEKQF